jgi:hypothetical protein
MNSGPETVKTATSGPMPAPMRLSICLLLALGLSACARLGPEMGEASCPVPDPRAKEVLARFLTEPPYQNVLRSYGLSAVDTTTVRLIVDARACARLNRTVSRVLADSILTFDPDDYDRTYLASGRFYYAVSIPRPLKPPAVLPEGVGGFVTLGRTGIIAFREDYSYLEGFPY